MKYYEILIFLTSVSAAFSFFLFFTLSDRDSGGQPTTRCIGHNTHDS